MREKILKNIGWLFWFFLLLLVMFYPMLNFIVYGASGDKIITYNPSTNIITAIGGNESYPIDFEDLWSEDVTQNRTLLDYYINSLEPPAPSESWFLTSPFLYPADSKAMKIYFDIRNYSRGGGLIIYGNDLDGNAQDEEHLISGNISFLTDYWYSELTKLTFEIGHEYNITVIQPRWGVVWKTGDVQFQFNTRIVIGNDTATTWFKDNRKQISFKNSAINADYQTLIKVNGKAYFIMGILIDLSTRRTKDGVSITFDNSDNRVHTRLIEGDIMGSNHDTTFLYSCQLQTKSLNGYYRSYLRRLWSPRIWHSLLDSIEINDARTADIYDLTIWQNQYGISYAGFSYANEIIIYNSYYYHVYFYAWIPATFRNLKASIAGSGGINVLSITTDKYFIDSELDNWSLNWGGTSSAEIYRQYSFKINITDTEGAPIQNANVTLKDINDIEEFSVLTGSNGSFKEQIVNYGFYNQTGGNTPYLKTPHNLTITHSSYDTLSYKVTIDKWKTVVQVVLGAPRGSYGGGLGSGFILAFIISLALAVSGVFVVASKRRS